MAEKAISIENDKKDTIGYMHATRDQTVTTHAVDYHSINLKHTTFETREALVQHSRRRLHEGRVHTMSRSGSGSGSGVGKN